MKRFIARFTRAAVMTGLLAGFTGCESTDSEAGGGAYYDAGFYDAWYYGGDYNGPDVIVTPPERPEAPPRPAHPIATPPPPVPRPTPMPSVPSMPRPAFRR